MVSEFREAGVGRRVLLGWDVETNTGNPPVPNDHAAEVRNEFPDFFVGFGSVDPPKDDRVEEAERCVEDLDLSGFKFQQNRAAWALQSSFAPLRFSAIDSKRVLTAEHPTPTQMIEG